MKLPVRKNKEMKKQAPAEDFAGVFIWTKSAALLDKKSLQKSLQEVDRF